MELANPGTLRMHRDEAPLADDRPPLVVRRIADARDLQDVYRFRYRVYVEEMGRSPKYADHAASILKEPLDATGRVFGAYRGEDLVGTLRFNLAADTDLGDYAELYGLRGLAPEELARHSIATGLMALPSERGGTVSLQLLHGFLELMIECGTRFASLDSSPPLVRTYERIGCRAVREDVHPDYGRVTIMRFDAADQVYLERVESPFRHVCGRLLAEGRSPWDHSLAS